MSPQLALFLAACASALLSSGLYLMKREAPSLPALSGGVRWRAWGAFLTNRVWLAGLLLQTAGYGVYLTVLRFAPLSLVHTALTGGLVLFLMLAVSILGERPARREWIGGLTVTTALVLFGLSLDDDPAPGAEPVGLWWFVGSQLVLAVLAIVFDRRPGRPVGYAIAGGLVLGLSGIFAKLLAVSPSLADAVRGSALWLTILSNVAGFSLMQSALQSGRGVVVVPILTVLSDMLPIAGGILVFRESLPTEQPEITFRWFAFVLALSGAALLATAAEPHSARLQVRDSS
jgi:drug/metabolite transporter (DMT)-like permease